MVKKDYVMIGLAPLTNKPNIMVLGYKKQKLIQNGVVKS